MVLLSYLCAAFAALGNASANVMQRKASLAAAPHLAFGRTLLADLVRNRTWLLGISGMVASFGLQAAALGLGELSAVEPILTLEVPLTLLVASYALHARLGREEWVAIIVMTAGMIALIAALNPRPGHEEQVDHVTYIIAGGATAATIVVLVILARHQHSIWRTACLGAATGTSFGLTATLVKESVGQLTHHGIVGLVATWQTYVAMGFGLLGVLLMQWAVHSGPLLASQPGFTLMDPLVSILWGVLVYEERVRTGGWLALATVGGLAVGSGVALLARSPLFDPEIADSARERAGDR